MCVVDSKKQVGYVKRRIAAIGLFKTTNGCRGISGFLLHKTQIGPQLSGFRTHLDGLPVVLGCPAVIARCLSLLGLIEYLGESLFQLCSRRLLAESHCGFSQQSEQQRSEKTVHVLLYQ